VDCQMLRTYVSKQSFRRCSVCLCGWVGAIREPNSRPFDLSRTRLTERRRSRFGSCIAHRSYLEEIHRDELHKTYAHWQRKPLICEIYRDFYLRIRSFLFCDQHRYTVELGAGFAGLKSVFPVCIATDLFPTPWVDQLENVYRLSFSDATVSNLVMMDVFHHLEFPGDALAEFMRVLKPKYSAISGWHLCKSRNVDRTG
jgi:hypothetical protein